MVGKDPDTMAHVLAARAVSFDTADPLRGLRVADDAPAPTPPAGWARVRVRAAGLNRHDIFSLQGVGLRADELPRVLGCDGAGLDDEGNAVVVHGVIGDPVVGRGDPVNDPKRSLLSERYDGTFADYVVVPAANVVPKPAELTFEEAACLPTAWLTAYRMLFVNSATRPGDTVLVQGAGGGVSTAAIALARAAGLRVWVTSRTPEKRARAVELGAHAAFEPGARLPERVDAVLESVGQATWAHSVRSLRPGGRPMEWSWSRLFGLPVFDHFVGVTKIVLEVGAELRDFLFGQIAAAGRYAIEGGLNPVALLGIEGDHFLLRHDAVHLGVAERCCRSRTETGAPV